MSKATVKWDVYPETGKPQLTGTVSLDGRVAGIELVLCPASRRYTAATAWLFERHAEVGGTWGLPKKEARREAIKAAKRLLVTEE